MNNQSFGKRGMSLGSLQAGPRVGRPVGDLRRGRSYTPVRGNSEHLQLPGAQDEETPGTDRNVIQVHASHRGTLYRRKPKKKTKKKRSITPGGNSGFLQLDIGIRDGKGKDYVIPPPVQMNANDGGFRNEVEDPKGGVLIEEEGEDPNAMNDNRGGAGGMGSETVGIGYDDQDRSEQTGGDLDRGASASAMGGDDQSDIGSIATAGPSAGSGKRRRRGRKGLHREKKEKAKKRKRKLDMPDYDKLAEFEMNLGAGSLRVGEEDTDPWALIVPQEDLQDEKKNNQLGELSYKEVKLYQYQNEPRDRYKRQKFPWFKADLSYIPFYQGSIKKTKWVTPCAKEIGLGPTLFLHTQKAFAYLFALFLIVNLPLFFFYARGNGASDSGGAKSSQFTDVFGILSVGNLGVSDYSCANINIGKNERILRFNCPYGTMRELTSYGLQKNDNQSCTDEAGTYIGENNAWNDLQIDCNYDKGMHEGGQQRLKDAFETECLGEPECEITISYDWFDQDCKNRLYYYAAGSKYNDFARNQSWTHYQRDQRRREPIVFGVAFCIADQIFNPITGDVLPFQKSEFTYFLVLIDFFVVIFSICFINMLERRYKQYAHIFDKRNVEMRDFTLRISNLPNDYEYGGKELMLQAQLWNHIELQVQRQLEARAINANNDMLLDRIHENRHWEIIDLNFGKNDLQETEMLEKLDELDREKKKKIFEVMKIKKSENADQMEGQVETFNEEIIDLIRQYKELKGEFIKLQEEKLYEPYEIGGPHGYSKSDISIRYAYVTFRSMVGKEECQKCFAHAGYFAKQNQAEEAKMFFGRFLEMSETCAPSSIKWKHIQYSECNRTIRSILIWTLAILVVLLAFYGMVRFKDWNDELKAGAALDTQCPSQPVEISVAYEDFLKPGKQRQGFLHCFCLTEYQDKGGDVSGVNPDFLKLDASLEENPCEEWKWVYVNNFYLTIISGAMIGALNGICVVLFQHIVMFEKCLTYMDEIKSMFSRIVLIQFLNIACVLIFADFNLGYASEDIGIPILVGKYTDFDTKWYFDVGAKISMAMVSNSVAPFAGKIFEPLIVAVLRWLDRDFKKHLRKKTNVEEELAEQEKLRRDEERKRAKEGGPKKEEEGEEEEAPAVDPDEEGQDAPPLSPLEAVDPDEVETKGHIFQDDLNEFYLGTLCQVFYIYSWFFTNLLVYFMYGGGIPLMYGLGFLHFVCGYLAYKYLFVNFYRKSYGFDEEIPLYSVRLMKWAIFLHISMNLFMYTNKRLLTPDEYTQEDHYRPKMEPLGSFFRRRYDTLTNQAVLYFFIVICIFYVFWKMCIMSLCNFLNLRDERKKARQLEADDERYGKTAEAEEFKKAIAEDHSNDILRELKITALRDLYYRSQKEYELFRTMVNALSYDQEKLSDEYAKFFKMKLKERVGHIEDTIDTHLNLINGLERFIDKSYLYKLLVLEKNEEKIPMKDHKALRMVDVIQSYNIYDALDFQKVKQVIQRIDRELLDLDYLEQEQPVYC